MGAVAGKMLGSAVAGSPLGKFIGAVGGDSSMGLGQAAGGNPFSAARGNIPVQAGATPASAPATDTSPYVDPKVSAPNFNPQATNPQGGIPGTAATSQPTAAPTVVPQGGGGNMENPKALSSGASPTGLPQGPGGSLAAYRAGIQNNESGGNYQLVGNATNGDHPYGAYGVMGANVGPWTKAALGTALTPQQFLASPEAQDKVFDHQFSQYVTQYGAEGAAQAWLGGPGSVGKVDRKDNLGTSVGAYGKKFTNFVNNYDPNAPTSAFKPDMMSAKDGQSANQPGNPDDLLMQTSLAILQGKDGTTSPTATEKPSDGAEVLGSILSRVGRHGAPQLATAQTAPSQTVDLGAQDVASASQQATQRRAGANQNGAQRKAAIAARVSHKPQQIA